MEKVREICIQILPIIGVLALLILIVLLIKAISLVNKAKITVNTANKYLDDLNTAVKTINNVSFSVEALRVTLENNVKRIYHSVSNEYNQVKNLVYNTLKRENKNGGKISDDKSEQ